MRAPLSKYYVALPHGPRPPRGHSRHATLKYFPNLVSHHEAGGATYLQRYYLNDTAFGGPGSPIFMIMGGEGAILPTTGFFYPWVVDHG